MDQRISLKNITLVAFDLETTGAYPVSCDICEIAAVKWQNGEVIDTYQTLLKPRELMSDFIIGIHGITNEMVQEAPKIDQKIREFYDFIYDSVLVAHHAPFDLGFLAYEFEKKSLTLPKNPVLCSSLLSRKLFPESPNHKLQTLIPFLGLHKGAAHRALDDSKACLELTLRCFERFGRDKSFDEIQKIQEHKLLWSNFSLFEFQRDSKGLAIIRAIEDKKELQFSYRSPNDNRVIRPIGIVRNPNGDYLVATEGADVQQKRFYLNKVVDAKIRY